MSARSNILLTGGTGQLGKRLLRELDNENFQTDVVTRNVIAGATEHIGYLTADLLNAETMHTLGRGYDSIIHCASDPANSGSTDILGTQNLLRMINRSSVRNFMYVSIVGVDQTNYTYYQNKLKTEQLIIGSGIPYTILRVTQFHDFVHDRILKANNPENEWITAAEGLTFQSIDLADVCIEMLRSLKQGASNSIIEIGGPEVLKISEIVKSYQEVVRSEKKLSIVSPQNDFQKLFTTGINLCPNHRKGKINWRDFLLKKYNNKREQ